MTNSNSSSLSGLSNSKASHLNRFILGPEVLRRCAIAAFPIAIAPRAPPRVRLDLARRRVPAMAAPRGATAEPRARHPASGPGAVHTHAVGRVGRARRQVAATPANDRRERPLIELDKAKKAPRRNARRHNKPQPFDWFRIGPKRSRCGAPDLAPPALIGRSGDEAPAHVCKYSCFAGAAQAAPAPRST